jgi:hypothetical protein
MMQSNTKLKIISREGLSTPKLVEIPDRKNDWILYGANNDYGTFLLSLLDKSSIHASIQYGKINMTIGKGLVNEIPFATQEAADAFAEFVKSPNNEETLEDITYKIVHDLVIYGSFYLECVWSKDRQSIAEIYHIPYDKIRVGKPEKGKITHYWYSDDWTQIKKEEYAPVEIAAFSMDERRDPVQLMCVREYNASSPYYGKPQYYPSIPYCQIDGEVAEYHLNSIEGGLSADYIIQLNNAEGMTQEEQDETYYNIKKELSGASGNKWMLTFGSSNDQQPNVIPIPTSDTDTKFLTLQEACMQNILTANKLTNPSLVGIKTAQGLGSKDELIDAYDLYYETVISKLCKMVTKTYDKILAINEIPTTVAFEKAQPVPFSLSEQALLTVLSVNEVRDMLGMGPQEINETTQTPTQDAN